VAADYPVSVTFDHSALVAAGKSLPGGEDLRLVYRNGGYWREIDRALDPDSAWDSTTTTLWFKLQAPMGPFESDTEYYLYYGNSGAGAPPDDPLSVFLFYDDFSGSSVDLSLWSVGVGGTPTVSGGLLTLNPDNDLWAVPAYAAGLDTRWEARVQLPSSPKNTLYFWAAVDQRYFAGSLMEMYSEASGDWASVSDGSLFTANRITLTTPTDWHTYAMDREGSTDVRFYQDTSEVATIALGIPTVDLRAFMWNGTASQSLTYDWVRVRPIVQPEPTATAGTEQASIGICALSFWFYDDTAPDTYMMYPAQPAGTTTTDGSPDVRFHSAGFSDGTNLTAGSTTVYVYVTSTSGSDETVEAILEAGAGLDWTFLGTGAATVPANTSVPELIALTFDTDGYTFADGEKLRLTLYQSSGLTSLYWDGSYNSSRIALPEILPP
jgi:hypothetical protein